MEIRNALRKYTLGAETTENDFSLFPASPIGNSTIELMSTLPILLSLDKSFPFGTWVSDDTLLAPPPSTLVTGDF